MYANSVYYEATNDSGGKDVLGIEKVLITNSPFQILIRCYHLQAMDNPVYGICSRPASNDIDIRSSHSSDDNTSVDNASNDVLVENVYVNYHKKESPQDGEYVQKS